MARVTRHTKNRGGKHTYRCVAASCKVAPTREGSRDILPGDTYYEWSRRFGRSGATYRQHTECGYPKRTQLSSSKTAAVEEAAEDAEKEIAAWAPELPTDLEPSDTYEIDWSEVEEIMEQAAQAADEAADEYEAGVENMPEGLQYSPTAEAMNSTAEALREWAENVRDWASSLSAAVDLPDPETDAEDAEDGSWREAAEAAFDDVVEEIRSATTDALGDVPGYEG